MVIFGPSRKERPYTGFGGFGGGAASLSTVGGGTENEASGGTKTTSGDYTIHTFNNSGAFTVSVW